MEIKRPEVVKQFLIYQSHLLEHNGMDYHFSEVQSLFEGHFRERTQQCKGISMLNFEVFNRVTIYVSGELIWGIKSFYFQVTAF